MLQCNIQPPQAEFLSEIEIMAGLKHEKLVQFVGVCAAKRPWLAVLEFVPYGDLHGLLVVGAQIIFVPILKCLDRLAENPVSG